MVEHGTDFHGSEGMCVISSLRFSCFVCWNSSTLHFAIFPLRTCRSDTQTVKPEDKELKYKELFKMHIVRENVLC